jgi:hypothetical protein
MQEQKKDQAKENQENKKKTKPSVADKDGHYDIDGVSFTDDAGVVVASDATKNLPPENPLKTN